MSEERTVSLGTKEIAHRSSEFRRFWRVFFTRRVVMFGMIVIMLFLIVTAFAEFIAPYDPNEQNWYDVLAQPSSKHLLGTDAVGRDTLSRIIFGSRISLMVGVVAIAIAAGLGITTGLVAGYFGGWVYTILMRCMDALMAFPMLLLALLIAATLGGGLYNILIALGVAMMPGYARMMCGQVLSVKENDYVLAGHAIGASDIRIMLRHVFPNCMPPLIVMMTMQMGGAILAEAGLSFIGVGIKPPIPAWGAMVNDGYKYLASNPMLSISPGVAIMLVVFSFNMVGDGLRDALDPRLRGAL